MEFLDISLKKQKLFITLLGGFLLLPCMSDGEGNNRASLEAYSTNWYHPEISETWQIQLKPRGSAGYAVNTNYPVELYDIDLFDSPVSLIQWLHASGQHVICYFSAGSAEDWRPDYPRFHDSEKGNALEGWPGENWLDIRSKNVREIMKKRMDIAQKHECDGVDPDNVEGYANKSGFDLTAGDQLGYNRFLATEAHKRHMAVALKNDVNQIKELSGLFDFSVNEECFENNECDKNKPFIEKNKPVFNIEYKKEYLDSNKRQELCSRSLKMKFSTLVLPLMLDDSFRYSCQ
jgi:hypothetical protein